MKKIASLLLILVLLIFSIILISKEERFTSLSKEVDQFHFNYNSDKFLKNYNQMKKTANLTMKEEDYEKNFFYVKSKLGLFKDKKIIGIILNETTSDNRNLIGLKMDSIYSEGNAIEIFYFDENNILYRHEIYSSLLKEPEKI